jgi:flagellum-specific ATP synthase
VIDADHNKMARRVLSIWAAYEEIEDLVNIGAYVAGANLEFDLAVQARPRITQYLQQEPNSPVTLEQARKQLVDLSGWIEQLEKVLKVQGKVKK